MSTYKVRWKAATKEAFVLPNAQANPAGTTAAGTFDHDDDADDNLGDDGNVGTENHVLYHHVLDCLRAVGVLNMQEVTILRVVTSVALYPATKSIDLSNAETLQLTWDLLPAGGTVTDVTFVSSDPAKATVSATGLVTPVATGVTTITMTHTGSGLTDTCVVTVVA